MIYIRKGEERMVKSVLGYWDRSAILTLIFADDMLCGRWDIELSQLLEIIWQELERSGLEIRKSIWCFQSGKAGWVGVGVGVGVVEIIWERIDLPGILYGMEVADVDDRVMEQLEAIGSPYISSPYTYSHFMHFGSTLSHRRYYMNHISITCRFSHSGLSWSPVSHRSHLI